MLTTMVSEVGGAGHPHPHEVLMTPPSMMEYHPALGHIPPDSMAYYGPAESFQYCADPYPHHPQMCVNLEYGKISIAIVKGGLST